MDYFFFTLYYKISMIFSGWVIFFLFKNVYSCVWFFFLLFSSPFFYWYLISKFFFYLSIIFNIFTIQKFNQLPIYWFFFLFFSLFSRYILGLVFFFFFRFTLNNHVIFYELDFVNNILFYCFSKIFFLETFFFSVNYENSIRFFF